MQDDVGEDSDFNYTILSCLCQTLVRWQAKYFGHCCWRHEQASRPLGTRAGSLKVGATNPKYRCYGQQGCNVYKRTRLRSWMQPISHVYALRTIASSQPSRQEPWWCWQLRHSWQGKFTVIVIIHIIVIIIKVTHPSWKKAWCELLIHFRFCCIELAASELCWFENASYVVLAVGYI